MISMFSMMIKRQNVVVADIVEVEMITCRPPSSCYYHSCGFAIRCCRNPYRRPILVSFPLLPFAFEVVDGGQG